MQWPTRAALYGGARQLAAIQSTIARIACVIARFEPVAVMSGQAHFSAARAALGDGVELWPIETEDLWCRDSGPTFVRDETGETAVVDFHFNGWGGRQSARVDGAICRAAAAYLSLPIFDSGLVGEEGGIEFDGAGLAMAHESSWVNRNRNGVGKAEITHRLCEAIGCDDVIWAPGLRGQDITDFHIDAVARFVRPGLVVIQLPARSSSDPFDVAASQTYAALDAWRGPGGARLEIVVMPSPDPNRIRSFNPEFVSAYVNYYICNGAVICAQFGDEAADVRAQDLLGKLYPGRDVVALDIDPLCDAGGGIHCATKQQPL